MPAAAALAAMRPLAAIRAVGELVAEWRSGA